MTQLIIAAHGTPGGSPWDEPANAHADRIRAGGRFEHVGTGFLRQEPAISEALRACLRETERSANAGLPELVVVPLFMAEGWYTRTVLPRELRRALADVAVGHVRLRLTRPVGMHPHLSSLVARAVRRSAPASARVVLIGHGTPRDPRSRRSTEQVAAELSRTAAFRSIDVAFLDEPPHLAGVLARRLAGPASASADIVVVPFFAGDGMHVREHIARTVADAGAPGRPIRVICAPAVGAMPEIADVIVRLARAATGRTEWVPST